MDTVCLLSLGEHWIMRKFEEYIIKIHLKANLDRLIVMHAISMIWSLKRKQIVTFFFKEKKETCLLVNTENLRAEIATCQRQYSM